MYKQILYNILHVLDRNKIVMLVFVMYIITIYFMYSSVVINNPNGILEFGVLYTILTLILYASVFEKLNVNTNKTIENIVCAIGLCCPILIVILVIVIVLIIIDII